jgi:hypothetical protein
MIYFDFLLSFVVLEDRKGVFDMQQRPAHFPISAGKPYAGEVSGPQPNIHRSTDAISGFSGNLPGIANTIGVRYPTQVKMSQSYVAERERITAGKPKAPMGRNAVAPAVPQDSDRWGNFIQPKTVNQQLANTYLEAVHGKPLDTTYGVGRPLNPVAKRKAVALPNNYGGNLSVADPTKYTAEAPPRIMGYSGFRPKVGELFGESFNRIENKAAVGGPQIALQRTHTSSSTPGRTTYESLIYAQ